MDEKKSAAPEPKKEPKPPRLKTVTSNDVGKQTETKASQKGKA